MQYAFSDNVSSLQPSAIREILKFTSMPGVISFAAGNPASEAFPVDHIRQISADLLQKDPLLALQYNITEGYPKLRELLKKRMEAQQCFDPSADDLITTSGAQQANELACKVLLNRGDTMLCESPSFIGSLNAFRSYGVNLVGVPMEQDGMDLNALEEALRTSRNPKLIYVIPNFQNPTGRVMSLEKRKGLYELACRYNVVILEDKFKAVSSVLKVCTDDGSYGQKGVVTEALKELIDAGNQYDEVFAIGPMVMMKFVSKTTEPYGIPTTVSMSPIMIDGTGMCGGCRLSVGGEMKFACVDGPDFDGHKVDWDLAVKRNQMYRDFEAHKYEETCNLFKKEAE